MSSLHKLTVLVCQISVPPDMRTTIERDEHLARVADIVSDALSRQSCDLVVLPELSSVSYSRYCFEHPEKFSENVRGQTFTLLSQVAQKHAVNILYGAPGLRGGRRYISQFLIDDKGNPAGVYDKLHVAQFGASMEKDYFTRGENMLIFEIQGIRLATVVCYDMRFASLADELTRHRNVDVILHPVAFYQDRSFYSWHSFVMTRALENQVYWLSVNRAGEKFGYSILCPPWADETTPETVLGAHEELVYYDIDRQAIIRARERYSFVEDRLEDYSLLSD